MKRSLSLFIVIALCASTVHAQYTPMSAYKRTENTTVDLSDTTGFTKFQLKKEKSKIAYNTSTTYLSKTDDPKNWGSNGDTVKTFPIGFNFPYGSGTFQNFVLTGDGTVFLSNSDTLKSRWSLHNTNSLITNAFNATFRANRANTNASYNWTDPNLFADSLSFIGYKTVTDGSTNTLYLKFKNIILGTTLDTNITPRATYTIVLSSDGSIAINLEEMPTVRWKKNDDTLYNPIFGLSVSFKSLGSNDIIFLKGWDDLTFAASYGSYSENCFPMRDDKWTQNTQINMSRPENCQAPANANAEWSGTPVILPSGLTGTVNLQNADGAFIIVSTDGSLSETLTDGKYYFPAMIGTPNPNTGILNSPDSIAGCPVIAAKKLASMANGTLSLNLTGLTSATNYYVYVFTYNDLCANGPTYGSVIKIPFKTPIPPPTVTAAKIGKESIKLQIDNLSASDSVLVGIAATNYYVSKNEWIPSNIESDTLVYVPGEPASGGFIPTPAKASYYVKKQYYGKITGNELVVEGLNEGQAYYFYVWGVNEGQLTATHSQARTRTISGAPCVFNYATDNIDAGLPVAGWETPVSDNISVVSTAGGGLFAPAEKSSSLLPDLVDNDYNKAIKVNYTGNIMRDVISPYFVTPLVDNVIATTLRITSSGFSGESNITSIAAGDTISVEYKKISDAEWTVAKVYTEGTLLEYDNNYANLETPLTLTAGDTFQIKYYLHFAGGMMAAKNVYIKSVEIVPELPCKYAQNITVNNVLTTNAVVALDWTDINTGSGAQFIYAVREKGQNDWSAYTETERELGLSAAVTKEHTTYEVAVRAICGAGDSSEIKIAEVTTLYGTPYKQSFTGMTELPADYQKASATLVQQGAASFTTTSGDWWQDEPMGSKLLGVNGKASNSWLLFPAIYLNSTPGDVTLDFIAKAFYKSDTLPVFDTCRTQLYVLAASTRDSLNGNHVLDTVDVVTLSTEWSPVSVDLSALTEHLYLAFYLVKDGVSSAASSVYLQVDSFDIDYRSVPCPGVSNIQTSNLTATGVTISWEGTALEYGVFYTNATTGYEDTVYSQTTSADLTDLDEETTYTFYIQPYCGEDRTNPGTPSDGTDFFSTPESVASSLSALSKKFEISSSAGRISILNPSAVKIDRVEVTGINGVVLQQKNVKTSGNMLLPAVKTPQVAVVRIISGSNEYTYKILVK